LTWKLRVRPVPVTTLRDVRKLTESEVDARTVRATVPVADRVAVLKAATSKIRAKAQIDFVREVRRH
jgi:hypothetical protein